MTNVQGIEGFVKAFIGWYEPFLKVVETFNIDDRSGVANKCVEERPWKNPIRLDGDSRGGFTYGTNYSYPEGYPTTFTKGTLPDLSQKEQELVDKIHQLSQEHHIDVIPVFADIRRNGWPQYDLFAHSVLFDCETGQKIGAHIGFAKAQPFYKCNTRVEFMFNPTLQLEGKNEGRIRCIVHFNGKNFAYLTYMQDFPTSNKGTFHFKDKEAFQIYVTQSFGGPVRLDCSVYVPTEKVGHGVITAFLEIVCSQNSDPNIQ